MGKIKNAICISLVMMFGGCTLTIKIEGKQERIVEVVKTEAVKPVAKIPAKSNYQKIKDEHNQDWLNLPLDTNKTSYRNTGMGSWTIDRTGVFKPE